MVGTADPVGDHTVAADLAARLPRAVVDVVEGAGHLPWLDDPRRVASALRVASDRAG